MKYSLLSAVLLFSFAGTSALRQQSQTSPGYSLARLNQEQCSYAVAVINQVTRNINAVSNGTLTEQNSRFPSPPKTVDAYVNSNVETLKLAPIDFTAAQLSDLGKPSGHAADNARVRISLQQREFAYVLELRGCALEPAAVRFVK